ncbi:MAG: division/cell wall cluster transcriptional repressor MraZ [Acidimicrobiales bacterium]
MERFHGSFEYSLDGKGRLILPARLRIHFESKRVLVSCYVDRCLAVWTPQQFDRHLARAEAMEGRGLVGRNLARALSAMSAEVELDGQWRLTIPPNLRDYAGLEPERPVTVVGALNRIELWRAELWKQQMQPSLESLADGTSPLFLGEPLLGEQLLAGSGPPGTAAGTGVAQPVGSPQAQASGAQK